MLINRLELELPDGLDHLFLLVSGQEIVKRQAEQLVADAFGDRAVAWAPAETHGPYRRGEAAGSGRRRGCLGRAGARSASGAAQGPA